jgi:hypothetical protein
VLYEVTSIFEGTSRTASPWRETIQNFANRARDMRELDVSNVGTLEAETYLLEEELSLLLLLHETRKAGD